MVTLRMRKDAGALGNTAGFGIACAIVEPGHAGRRDGSGAHRTGFQRDVECMVDQPFGSGSGTGRADRQYLRMGRRIVQLSCPVSRRRNDMPCGVHHHRAHGHFAAFGGGAGLCQRRLHMRVEFHAP